MIQITLTPEDYNLADLAKGLESVASRFMPKTARAFKISASLMEYTWRSMAQKILSSSTGAYARSIKIRMLTPYQYEIYTDHPLATVIEDGAKEYDMKTTHPYGKQSRVVKKTVKRKGKTIRREGDPYLIVPFRQGVPGAQRLAMPESIYKQLRQMITKSAFVTSEVTTAAKKSKKVEPNYRGELIPRAIYNWGDRLRDTGMDRLEGMIAMDVPSGKKESRSEYLTFRVISVNSPAHKWLQPARKGHHFTQEVVKITEDAVQRLLSEAFAKDLGVT